VIFRGQSLSRRRLVRKGPDILRLGLTAVMWATALMLPQRFEIKA
jgi:hypothetical protein